MNRKLALLAVLLVSSITAWGQGYRIGYTNIDAIVLSMPEMTQINSDLEVYGQQLQSQINSKNSEIQKKATDLQQLANQPNTAQLVLTERQNELVKLQNDLRAFQTQADQAFSQKQADLINPVYTKVQNAIEEVRKDLNYDMILNIQLAGAGNVVLAAKEEDNITKQVFAKLGVPMPAETNTTPAATVSGNGNGN